jgi:hypothetical protein
VTTIGGHARHAFCTANNSATPTSPDPYDAHWRRATSSPSARSRTNTVTALSSWPTPFLPLPRKPEALIGPVLNQANPFEVLIYTMSFSIAFNANAARVQLAPSTPTRVGLKRSFAMPSPDACDGPSKKRKLGLNGYVLLRSVALLSCLCFACHFPLSVATCSVASRNDPLRVIVPLPCSNLSTSHPVSCDVQSPRYVLSLLRMSQAMSAESTHCT